MTATHRERWHGTLGGYSNHRCRCDECRAAAQAYERRRGNTRGGTKRHYTPRVRNNVEPRGPRGHALAVCWCEARSKRIPLDDIRAGQTFSCSPDCAPRQP